MLGTIGSGNMVLTNEEIIAEMKESIKKIKRFKEENKHPHCLICEQFEEGFNLKILMVKNENVYIQSRLPKDAEIGNILTNENYNPDDYIMALLINNCPFCAESLDFGLSFDAMIESMKRDMEV